MQNVLSIYCLYLLGTAYSWAQQGLKADYFNGIEFNEYVATNYVDNLDFYWNRTPPVKGVNPNDCSVRYTGRLKSPQTGKFTFSARVDDGIRVWVGNQQIINNWQLNDVGYSDGMIHLEADQWYDIKIEYFNALLEAELRLLWKLPEEEKRSWLDQWWNGDDAVVIPAQYFSPPVEEVVQASPKARPTPKPTPTVKKSKPKPKPKPTPKPSIVKQEPIVSPPKKKVVDPIQQYIPNNVEFDRAQSEILSVSYPELDQLANFLVDNPTRKVKIEGHTDNIGNKDQNLELSKRRAYAVAAYLVKKGVNHQQLTAEGFGGTRPLVTSYDKKYHPENRRVEFIVE